MISVSLLVTPDDHVIDKRWRFFVSQSTALLVPNNREEYVTSNLWGHNNVKCLINYALGSSGVMRTEKRVEFKFLYSDNLIWPDGKFARSLIIIERTRIKLCVTK